MAKKGKKTGGRRLQDQQYRQIISSSRPEAEKALKRLGLSSPSLEKLPHALRMSAQMATVERESTASSTAQTRSHALHGKGCGTTH